MKAWLRSSVTVATGQREIPLDAKTRLKVLCKVRYMSFSAHADTTGIQQLARHLQPKAVMLVHGEKEGMLKLARVLQRELGVPVHTPPTGQTVSVPLERAERRVPVYIHDHCFRRSVANLNNASPANSSLRETLWECDDPAVSRDVKAPWCPHAHCSISRFYCGTVVAFEVRFKMRGRMSLYVDSCASLFS